LNPVKRLQIAIGFLVLIFLSGTAGFCILEDLSITDSLYMTVVTISTVGFGDIVPQTTGGKWFTILLIIFGVGTMFYTFGQSAEIMIEGRFKMLMGRGKLEKMIKKLHNHYIICGCGRIGHLIGKELAAEKVNFVMIEINPEVIQKIEEEGFVFYKGDATQDKTLVEAGIKRAKGVVCVLPSDAENLYVILTAKELNPDVYILSRSEEEASESRLLRAGADRVMSPYTLGGLRMSMAILRPAMLDFIEISTKRQNLELRMEELDICDGSPLIGSSLEKSDIRQHFGLIIVAVKKDSGKMIFNPLASYIIEKGDKLIAMGENDNVSKFSKICMG
jgi:voltage-gated potassium channel